MKLKIVAVSIFVLAAALVVLALSLDLARHTDAADDTTVTAQSAAATPPAIPSPAPPVKEAGPSADSGSKSASAPGSAGEPQPEATRPSWDPQPTASDQELEVPEQTAPARQRMPESKKREPALKKVPKTQVAEGKLTDGFPKAAVPLPESSMVVRSSVEQQGKLVLVGVEGRSEQTVEQVLAFYSEHFAQREWLTTGSSVGQGTAQLRGAFGDDSTTVTVRQLPTGMTGITAAGVFKVKE